MFFFGWRQLCTSLVRQNGREVDHRISMEDQQLFETSSQMITVGLRKNMETNISIYFHIRYLNGSFRNPMFRYQARMTFRLSGIFLGISSAWSTLKFNSMGQGVMYSTNPTSWWDISWGPHGMYVHILYIHIYIYIQWLLKWVEIHILHDSTKTSLYLEKQNQG